MTYTYPHDPRPHWEWCPKCSAWYEIDMNSYTRLPIRQPGTCQHDENEQRLTEEEVRAASFPASVIAKQFLLKPGTFEAARVTRDVFDAHPFERDHS